MNPQNQDTLLAIWRDVYEGCGGHRRHEQIFAEISPHLRSTLPNAELQQLLRDQEAEQGFFTNQLRDCFRAGILGALRSDGFRLEHRAVRQYLRDEIRYDMRVDVADRGRHVTHELEIRVYCVVLHRQGPWLIRQGVGPRDSYDADRVRRSDGWLNAMTGVGSATMGRELRALQDEMDRRLMESASIPPGLFDELTNAPPRQHGDQADAALYAYRHVDPRNAPQPVGHVDSNSLRRDDVTELAANDGNRYFCVPDGRFYRTRAEAQAVFSREFGRGRDLAFRGFDRSYQQRPVPANPVDRGQARRSWNPSESFDDHHPNARCTISQSTIDGIRGLIADRIIVDDPQHAEPSEKKQCHTCTKIYATNHMDWWMQTQDEKWYIPDHTCHECATKRIMGIQLLRQLIRSIGDALAFAFSAAFSFRREYIYGETYRLPELVQMRVHKAAYYLACTRHPQQRLATSYSRALTDAERALRSDGAQYITYARCGHCKAHEDLALHVAAITLPQLMLVCAAALWDSVDSMTKRFVLVRHERETQHALDVVHSEAPYDAAIEFDVPADAVPGAMLDSKPPTIDTQQDTVRELLLEMT